MKHIAKIQRKKWLSYSAFGLELHMPGIAPRPGQFFQLTVNETCDPFLNRPISIASYNRDRLHLIVKVVGRGTRLLSEKKEGDLLTLYGPFGNGVKVKKKKSLLVAGGIGVAPLYFLAQNLYRKKVDFTFLYGAKRPSDLILKNNIIKFANEAIFITEFGGKKRATAISALKEIDVSEYGIAYACGPKEMLVELQRLELKMPVYAFCEDFMGCGNGLCLGCAIKYNGVYKRICKDGPVFELKGISFE
jgi:dihydroorotate dehydrogenase electron transfer subunit